MVLVYPVSNGLVLLGRKRKRLCAGYLVGFGGRQRDGETLEEAASRELQEETGLSVLEDLRFCGQLQVIDPTIPEGAIEIAVYTVSRWTGNPRESDEIEELQKYPIDCLPWPLMRPSDRAWLPRMLAGSVLNAVLIYDRNGDLDSFCVTQMSGVSCA